MLRPFLLVVAFALLVFPAIGCAGADGDDDVTTGETTTAELRRVDGLMPVAEGHYYNATSNAALLITRDKSALRASLRWNGARESALRVDGPSVMFESGGCSTRLVQRAESVEAITACANAAPRIVQMKRDRDGLAGRYVAPPGHVMSIVAVSDSNDDGVTLTVTDGEGRTASGSGPWSAAATAVVSLGGCGDVHVALLERGIGTATYVGGAPTNEECPALSRTAE